MDDALLNFSIPENGFNRPGKTCQTIYACDQNIFHSTILQLIPNEKPELRTLVLPELHTKRLFVSFHINPYGDINLTLYTPAFVAYMVMDGIHENDCIDFFLRSFLHFLRQKKSYPNSADDTVRNLDITQLTHVAFDIVCVHSFGIHGDDLPCPK